MGAFIPPNWLKMVLETFFSQTRGLEL